jgi:MFS family permease
MQLYTVQFAYGIVTAFAFPTYMALFTRHVDRDKEGTEWALYFTLTNLGSAFTAFVGGIIATAMGFDALIIGSVIVAFVGGLALFPIRHHIYHHTQPTDSKVGDDTLPPSALVPPTLAP